MVFLLYFIFLFVLYNIYINLLYGFYAVINTNGYIYIDTVYEMWYAWCEDLIWYIKPALGNNMLNGIIVHI